MHPVLAHPESLSQTPGELPTEPRWSFWRWASILTALTLATFLIHGYHPLAEDGGLYVAGVEYTLNHALFPHFNAFVTEHLHFSVFAPLLAAVVRLTRLSLASVLLLAYLGSIAFTLLAARAVLRRSIASNRAQLAGLAMLSAMWTLPVAATSLLLFDPYLTARSFSTPLSLLAVAFAMDPWPSRSTSTPSAWRSLAACILCVVLAILLHPLMAGYGLGLVLLLRVLRRPRNLAGIGLVVALTLILAAVLQAISPAESPNVVWASFTRYYWFLSQWHWYELLGLLGPLLVFAALLRWRASLGRPATLLFHACIALALLAIVVALLFAHESYRTHLVARLQPLRSLLLIYAVMVLFLGAALQRLADSLAARTQHVSSGKLLSWLPALAIAATAFGMFRVQRAEFPASAHLELPWSAPSSPNPWVQAFRWCRANTPVDALFALDAHYITLHGEDAQTFRAIALRSALPDFSKDGGEAAITPSLADQWAAGVHAQAGLSHETDAVRLARLQPFGVTWLVLLSSAHTALPCPYQNGTVKVCRLVR